MISFMFIEILLGIISTILTVFLLATKRYNLFKKIIMIVFGLFIILLSSCHYLYQRDLLTKQIVNIEPIKIVNISKNIDSIIPKYKDYNIEIENGLPLGSNTQNSDGKKECLKKKYNGGVIAEISLFYNEENAIKMYDFERKYGMYKPILDKLEEDINGKYCISYVKEVRGDSEGGSRPTGYYESFVIFQKKNLLIEVSECIEGNSKGNKKDNVIKTIADKLTKNSN